MRLFSSLLLWLMMLAIPTQGFAAASMLYCGMSPEHHAVQAQPMPEPHHEAGTQAHVHGEVATVSDHAQQAQDPAAQLPDAAHKCGVCASCCNLIAIAEFASTVAANVSPPAQYLEPLVQVYAAPLHLLDKPPRS